MHVTVSLHQPLVIAARSNNPSDHSVALSMLHRMEPIGNGCGRLDDEDLGRAKPALPCRSTVISMCTGIHDPSRPSRILSSGPNVPVLTSSSKSAAETGSSETPWAVL